MCAWHGAFGNTLLPNTSVLYGSNLALSPPLSATAPR